MEQNCNIDNYKKEYLLVFKDIMDLYNIKTLIIIDKNGNSTYDEIYKQYSKISNEVIENAYEIEDDGIWRLENIIPVS